MADEAKATTTPPNAATGFTTTNSTRSSSHGRFSGCSPGVTQSNPVAASSSHGGRRPPSRASERSRPASRFAWCGTTGKALWQFHEEFYWDDDGLQADDVKALVLQRERSQQQKLNTGAQPRRVEEEGGKETWGLTWEEEGLGRLE